MSGTGVSTDTSTQAPEVGTIDMKLEVVVVPVSDVDRAKDFYKRLGFREDIDFVGGDGYRVVQLTPPGSACSIIFGKGVTAAEPGSIDRLVLAVSDIDAARDELARHGVEVSVFFDAGGGLAGFDGRAWIRNAAPTPRMPRSAIPTATSGCCRRSRSGSRAGCGLMDVAALAELLHETAEHHGAFEAVAPPHDWWDWYAAYMDARQRGSTPEEASAAAGRYMAEVKGVVVE